jgi:hypothetical protein
MDSLENERTVNILKLISNLQADGKAALESKLLLLDLKAKSTDQLSGPEMSAEALKEQILQNKDSMTEIMTYLTKGQS